MIKTPSASYSIIIRLEIFSKPGMLGKVTSTIGRAGGDIGAVDWMHKTYVTLGDEDIKTFKQKDVSIYVVPKVEREKWEVSECQN